MTAWRFLRGQGIAARDIVVGGDSAGGNLTVTLINRLRAAGEEQPACALACITVDRPDDVGRLARDQGRRRSAHPQGLSRGAGGLLRAGTDRPQGPADLAAVCGPHRFSPVLIQVGSAETLLDDSVRLARAAGLADINVTLQVWPHMIHAWPMWNAKLAEGRRALEQVGEFVRRWVRP